MPLPPTQWTPNSGIGEAGSNPGILLMTEDGLELATEDGFSLMLETATYTPLPGSIWSSTASYETVVVPVYRPSNGIGESGNDYAKLINTQDGLHIITQDGKRLVTKQGTYNKLPATVWTKDDGQ